MLADAIEGRQRSEVLRSRPEVYAGTIDQIVKGSWRGKRRDQICASGYVAHSLEASMWSVGRTGNYRDAVLTAANLGEDADTTAAITGQLAGSLYGASAMPVDWKDRLVWAEKISATALGFVERRPGWLAYSP
jgi:ADP-ribosyl-[dinitrogen reductase] hydrolase